MRAVQAAVDAVPAVEEVEAKPAVLDDDGNVIDEAVDYIAPQPAQAAIQAYVAQAGEVLFDDYATPQQLAAAFSGYTAAVDVQSIKQQISVLEASATPRRVREAVLGTDNGWLAALNTEIATLRGQI